MKENLLVIIALICFLPLPSCSDRKNINVTGQVIDEATGHPIPNAEVLILCWYMRNFEESSYYKRTLKTDKKGNFNANFEKGHRVDVASKALGYKPFRSKNLKLKTNEITESLTLAKDYKNPTLVTLFPDFESNNTFLKARVYAANDGKTLDFKNVETFGFDFKTLATNTDTLECDFWFRPIKKEEQPTTISTTPNGGIIPILDKAIRSSFLFEKNIAPKMGYKTTCKITGKEAGFFVLLRDGKTYGKIILEKSSTDITMPDGKGSYYKEFGKNVSVLYKPDGSNDLGYSNPDINLMDFLMTWTY